ncbi:hypothetical protein [Nocardioides sp. L-11A]|uniref:hypothetical protein n=1 Tax=Nocardioides sp. L-11A TaxID=3043848 RepID=UPI00249AD732|nr:hypothetical protein QJ852_07635 [Nocardioides sp. L-11A]
MSSPTVEVRNVPPWLVALVVIVSLAACSGAGILVGMAFGGSRTVLGVLQLVGTVGGYYLSRTILRRLYTPR